MASVLEALACRDEATAASRMVAQFCGSAGDSARFLKIAIDTTGDIVAVRKLLETSPSHSDGLGFCLGISHTDT